MPEVELLFMLLVAVTVLVLIARRLDQPYPILLVLGGLLLGFVPGIPRIDMHSEVVFLVFLPPLLFADAHNTSWRDFRHDAVPILRLAIILVLVTASVVAVVAHALIPGLPWAAAFVLGAVVAPTDPVATEAIAERLHLPRRTVTILKGESLVNDASAIVIYRIALAVALGGAFSLGTAIGNFFLVSLGGVAVGLAVGWVMGRVQKYLPQDPAVETTVSLLTPLAAYLPAENLHVSGVLAVVACGIYLGRLNPHIVSSQTRLQSAAVWKMLAFLLNGILFLLVGLQLRHIVEDLPRERPFSALLWTALLVSLTVVITRILWVFLATYLPRKLFPGFPAINPFPSWNRIAIVAWSGMRGGISLAVALAIPRTLGDTGTPFPARDEILFITFGVILFTLVAQGLSLPAVIRALGVVGGSEEREEELQARLHVYSSALDHWKTRAGDSNIPTQIYDEIGRFYVLRQKHLTGYMERISEEPEAANEAMNGKEAYIQLKRELMAVERAAVLALRDDEKISDETLRRILRDQDLDEARIESLRPR